MKYITRFLIVVLAVGVVSCSDEFLESEPTEFISAERMSEVGPYNPDLFNGMVSGLYSLMYQTGTGGTDLDHDDFGQKSWDIYSGILSGNMSLAGYNYGWYSDVAKLVSSVDNTNNDNYKPWRYYYRIIRGANTIIDGLGGNEADPETDTERWQLGQAKTMRAYAYFYLANLFGNEYDPAAEILPIYTSTEQTSQPLSPASDVYDLIKSDLEHSVQLLEGYSRTGLQQVNVDVANGLLAYTYLTMGEYENASATAQEVIDAGYSIVPYDKVAVGGEVPRNAFSYIDGDGADWIWGMDLTLDQGLDLVSFWGQVDVFTYSYAAVGDPKTMDAGLYNSIPETDERKDWFGPHPWYGIPRCPLNKFYHEDRAVMNQREVTADYVYMRVEEMYLIKAEAEAFANDDAAAQTALETLVEQRDSDTDYISSLTGQDLKDEIYKQWRIEMWGEGKSYMALKRFEKDVYRQGHIDYNEVAIPYNDNRITMEIPYQEIQDNPNITQ